MCAGQGIYTFDRATLGGYSAIRRRCDRYSNNCDGNLWYRGYYNMEDSKVRLVLKLGYQLGTDFQNFIL